MKTRTRYDKWVSTVALLLICVGFILPLIWMISTSLKTLDDAMSFPPKWIPTVEVKTPTGVTHEIAPQWQNYYDVLHHPKLSFPTLARNTILMAVMMVLGTTISSAIVAYGFAKIRFKGNGFLFGLMLATMMIPFPVTMVSLFTIFRWLGDHTPFQFLGTLRPLWLPAWFGSAFNIFLLRQFFMTIPDELSEAATVDGCSEWGIFRHVILPLAKPALIVVALFTFMGAWNDFLGPLVYIQHPSQYTLALGLQTFQSQHGGTQWNLLMAASLLVVTPIIVLFFLAQKTFIEGIATTGMKG